MFGPKNAKQGVKEGDKVDKVKFMVQRTLKYSKDDIADIF